MAFARHFSFPVDSPAAGQRLDRFLAEALAQEEMTRSRLQGLIREGNVLVDGASRKAGYLVRPGEEVTVNLPPLKETVLTAQEVPFLVLYEDDAIVVLSKPPGVVVHPACGHADGTLVHGLLHRCGDLAGIGGELRPGIVHRLDKDTSGCMVVAKNDQAHHRLVAQFKGKEITKIYHALLLGVPTQASGTVALPIGRHPVHRKKMAVRQEGGRPAVTHWRVLERFAVGLSLVEVRLETGRTHQIRVHMAALGHPVAGDPLYGGKNKATAALGLGRQCLHSSHLGFRHPLTGHPMAFTAPLWPDIEAVLARLRGEATLEERA
ncbi:MAG TPA: RluA family pseudouridine synthase [Desulfurivibrionaceae bacterium]|nr:RluA family pseudouridine synthase [Desulfurivibrionaceae bacterium]